MHGCCELGDTPWQLGGSVEGNGQDPRRVHHPLIGPGDGPSALHLDELVVVLQFFLYLHPLTCRRLVIPAFLAQCLASLTLGEAQYLPQFHFPEALPPDLQEVLDGTPEIHRRVPLTVSLVPRVNRFSERCRDVVLLRVRHTLQHGFQGFEPSNDRHILLRRCSLVCGFVVMDARESVSVSSVVTLRVQFCQVHVTNPPLLEDGAVPLVAPWQGACGLQPVFP